MAPDFAEMRRRRVVLADDGAGMPVERMADLRYRDGDQPLLLDVYRPSSAQAAVPAVVFVHGDSSQDPEALRDAKDWGQYVSWGELTASRGLAAVTFTHRSAHGGRRMTDVRDDIDAALRYVRVQHDRLGIDASRIALVGVSFGVPYAVSRAFGSTAYVKCAVALYGPLDLRGALFAAADDVLAEFSPLEQLRSGRDVPPLLIVKAGKDEHHLRDPSSRTAPF
jgi:hypothetical protein